MKIIANEKHSLHTPNSFVIRGQQAKPVEDPIRVKLLLDAVSSGCHDILGAHEFPTSYLSAIHDESYIEFLENGYEDWLRLKGSGEHIIPNTHPNRHGHRYSNHPVARAGFYIADTSTSIGPGTFAAAKGSADTALTAGSIVRGGEPLAYALCRPPGHHACTDLAWGFCYLNNCAILAEFLLSENARRVAIIDVDAHHGNGTQQIFYKRRDVFTVSIHVDPSNYPPFYTGYLDETGEGDGWGFNQNICLHPGDGDDAFLAAVNRGVESVQQFAPDYVIVALGFDAHENDPLSVTKVSCNGFGLAASSIRSLNLPTIIVQEGGYPGPQLGLSLNRFLVQMESN